MSKIWTILLIILLLFIGIFSSNTYISLSQLGFAVGPYTQNVTNNSITILWETSTPTR